MVPTDPFGSVAPLTMTGSRADQLAARLAGPLRGVIATVAALGVLSALLVDPAPTTADASRSATAEGAPSAEPGAAPAPGDPAAAPPGGPAAPGGAPGAPPAGGAPPALGRSVVPVAGIYRYEVQATRDGTTSTQPEEREIVQLSGDQTRGLVQITARLEGESQVSVIDWSPEAALVRSTRIESAVGASRDCTWSPPFAEFGALADGSSWNLSSVCQTDVGGIETTFEVTGSGRVTGATTVESGGRRIAVWQIDRDRTTTISAVVGADELRQVVREEGTILFDPARGVVVRSDVTVTLEGAQTGVTRRTSVLQDG
jgi:hypothetical protein